MRKTVYVGPTITGVAVRNTTYGKLPDNLSKAIEASPYLGGLCVPIASLSRSMEQIDRQEGSTYTQYKKALENSAKIQKGVS